MSVAARLPNCKRSIYYSIAKCHTGLPIPIIIMSLSSELPYNIVSITHAVELAALAKGGYFGD